MPSCTAGLFRPQHLLACQKITGVAFNMAASTGQTPETTWKAISLDLPAQDWHWAADNYIIRARPVMFARRKARPSLAGAGNDNWMSTDGNCCSMPFECQPSRSRPWPRTTLLVGSDNTDILLHTYPHMTYCYP